MQALDLPNLRDAPFRLGIDPDEAVEHGPWCKARDQLLAALAHGGAHVALLGGTGSGKTLLLHALARTLQAQGRAVRIADRGGVLPTLGDDFILLLDDAEQLDTEALARLAASKGSCVLSGSSALAERLPRPFATVALLPLSPDDIARFVAMRLAAAGQRRDLVQAGAVLALARLSSGAARQINALAGAALFLAGLDNAGEVTQHHVEEAAALRDGDAPPSSPPPAQSAPVQASAPEAVPRPAPLSPRAPARAPRPRLAIAAAGAALGLLVLAGTAALVRHPGKPPQPQQQATNTASARPSPPPAPAPPQPAPVKAPAPSPPPSEAPGAPASHEAPAPQPPANPPAPPHEETAAPSQDSDSARVIVRYRNGAAAEADRLTKALAAANPKFSHAETHAVQDTPRAPTIRFFYPEDVGAAWELEATLSATGDTWEVRNATRSPHKPRRGTLDVLLP